MAQQDEAEAIARRLAGMSPPMLWTSHGHAVIDAARTWVATYGATQAPVVETPAKPPPVAPKVAPGKH